MKETHIELRIFPQWISTIPQQFLHTIQLVTITIPTCCKKTNVLCKKAENTMVVITITLSGHHIIKNFLSLQSYVNAAYSYC